MFSETANCFFEVTIGALLSPILSYVEMRWMS